MTMKIGVLSDTHLNGVNKGLENIFEQYLSDMDMILHAGDFVSVEVVEFLSNYNFHGVHGNMDPIDVKEMLPFKKEIDLGSHRIGLIHGWGSIEGLEKRVGLEFRDVDIIVFGHSHRGTSCKRGEVLFFNPGAAVGQKPFGPGTLGILEVGDRLNGRIIEI